MKTKLLVGAVIFAANCAIANAQVLGGNAVGGVGGSLGGGFGGMREIGVAGHGTANGALGADVGTDSLRRSTTDLADRTSNRARSTARGTRERARSTVGTASSASKRAVAATQERTIAAQGAVAAGAEWGASSALDAGRSATTTASTARAATSKFSDVSVEPTNAETSDAALSGTIDKRAGSVLTSDGEESRLDANGEFAASADTSASRDGVRASSSATGDGSLAIRD